MADDGHEEQAVVVAVPPPMAELPEIKLFGRWSCDDVQISDMSLQVSCVTVEILGLLRDIIPV
jgi:small subunit ribosomal protein S5e